MICEACKKKEDKIQMYEWFSDDEVIEHIHIAKERLGSKLLILGHHYQQDQVIQFADLRGDSFLLARQAAESKEAEYIVFLGVNFMAETADIVTSNNQKVIIPHLNAGCIMANMVEMKQVLHCWKYMQSRFPGEIIPVTYVNSSAEVKAFCGKHGGLTCTSSSAEAAFNWAMQGGKRILFFPDQHLGRNTGEKIGVSIQEMAVWNRHRGSLSGSEDPRLILWDGYCPVHLKFTAQRIREIREKHPGIQVIVHPECTYETVKEADLNGSTEYIISCIKNSESGSSWAVGTEINLVKRIANENKDKYVISLDDRIQPCPDMMKIGIRNLLWCLDGILNENIENSVNVEPETAKYARMALERMLNIG